MKTTLTILVSCLLLCSCSQKQATSARPAIELVEASNLVAWSEGYVVSIGKRDGASLEGIHILHKGPNGENTQFVADKGTVSPGPNENCVNIILQDAKSVTTATNQGSQNKIFKELTLVLHK